MATLLPFRVTNFLRDPAHGLTQHGTYDISEESRQRSIVLSQRIAHEQKKSEARQAPDSQSQTMTWNIYARQLDKRYIENLRFNNELRKEFATFIDLVSKSLLSDSWTSSEVASATYFILRAIHRLYDYQQSHYGNDAKINRFAQSIRDDISKYFQRISDKAWTRMYRIGLKLLYFVGAPPAETDKQALVTLQEFDADACQFDQSSIRMFSQAAAQPSSSSSLSSSQQKLLRKQQPEYGKNVPFNDPLIHRSAFLLPRMTPLEQRLFATENHRTVSSTSTTTKKTKTKGGVTPGESSSKQKPPPKKTRVEKFSVDWIRQQTEQLAMMKLQLGDTSEMLDVESLMFQILELVHNSTISDTALQSQFTELLGYDALDLIALLIQNRALMTKLTARFMNYSDVQSSIDSQAPPRDIVVQNASSNPYGASFSITTASQKKREKQQLKDRKKKHNGKRQQQRAQHKSKPKLNRNDQVVTRRNKDMEQYKRAMASMGYQASGGGADVDKQALPSDATTSVHKFETGSYEQTHFPAPELNQSLHASDALIDVAKKFPQWAQAAFLPFGIKKLNAMQSQCFEKAFTANTNLLVCAPTGAGKTNVAIMCALREIGLNLKHGVLARADKFKIIYVAPMKALAQEIVGKFGKRLKSLGIVCRELTGDMQLTKDQIAETHVIVTTPEKWDVITRKSDSMVHSVKLLILDEVHLLQDTRGSVIEAIVARTNRLVESSQSMIRIVGLSATLPNYIDVAGFLKAENGTLYFDESFRPVPLSKTFIGVSDANSMRVRNLMNEVCYIKVEKSAREGHQVMVFVHSRKDTLKTAEFLREKFQDENASEFVEPDAVVHARMLDRITKRARLPPELHTLLLHGFATHHAGMRREHRKIVEEAFLEGTVSVLCCTATLAWGVNLPAHTVIIKGTNIYDSKRGGFVDCSILDVMQIFGRAGRPQFDTVGGGEAIIITHKDRLRHYITSMTNAVPIESNFGGDLVNHLNAEIVLGTVTNMTEAIQWLQYTYMYVRLIRAPSKYVDVSSQFFKQYSLDPFFSAHLKNLLETAAIELAKHKMARFDAGENFYPTDVGRISSYFYIDCATIGSWNKHLSNNCSVEDILDLICRATEFEQLQMRDDEERDLLKLRKECCPYEIKSLARGPDSPQTKANILLQCYIGRQFWRIDHPTLRNDMLHVKQNSGRIARALFEIALKVGYSNLACETLKMCNVIERQVWHHFTPLRQFTAIRPELCMKVERCKLSLQALAGDELSAGEIGRMIRDQKNGKHVKKLARVIPRVELNCTARPITRTLLAVDIRVTPLFNWVRNQHGHSQLFHIWVDDVNKREMYHHETYTMNDRDFSQEEEMSVNIVLPIPESDDERPPQYQIHFVSAYWLGSHAVYPLSFQHLIRPNDYPPQTLLLDLHPLSIKALQNEQWESVYRGRFDYFNPIQTQVFHVSYHTDQNILMCAPTGSGKTLIAELVTFRSLSTRPNQKIIYIAPLKALARERYRTWGEKFGKLGYSVIMLTGDLTPDREAINQAHIIITTPEKWDGISRYWKSRKYVKKVAVIIFDEIHLLGLDRGPILEVIVSRLRFVERRILERDDADKVRLLGLSTALANAEDLADWLGVTHLGLYNFPAAQRPVPCQVHIQGYPGKHYCPRMATMNKPCFAAIKSHSSEKPVLIFVSSRRQTRLTAIDLISFISRDANSTKFLHVDPSEMNYIMRDIKDANLRHSLAFGIGLHHAGLHPSDRKIVEDLFLKGCIQVLCATSTLAWGVNLPAHLVVVKGTEYFDPKTKRYVQMPVTDIMQMIGRAGRPQFDTSAVAVVLVQQSKKNFYKRFLYHSFPVESCLQENMHNHINAEIAVGTLGSMQDGVEYLTWTFLFRRITKNPTYYQIEDVRAQTINKYLRDMLKMVLWDLQDAHCIEFDDENRDTFTSTVCGQIASFYYVSYKTMAVFTQSLKRDSTLTELLRVLSSTTEYDELPVRHNEDKLNFELSKQVPYSVADLAMDEPSTKAVLLFQAHLSRISLPITDYVTDLRSVLDQSIRIVQAMIDYTSSPAHAWLRCTRKLVHSLQMITQGRWLNDSTLSNLPHITPASVRNLWDEGIETLPELLVCDARRLASILKRDPELSKQDVSDVIRCVRNDYPRVHVQVTLSSFEVGLDAALTLKCRMRRYSGNANKVYSPKWYKPKLEGWFVLVAWHGSDQLLAIKRARVSTQWRTNKLEIRTPSTVQQIPWHNEEERSVLLDVYVMCDSYLGLDQFYTIACTMDVAPLEANQESDPLLNLETADDLIDLKERHTMMQARTNEDNDNMTVLSGATFDTALLDPRNRPRHSDEVSLITDITEDDIQSIITQSTIPKWD